MQGSLGYHFVDWLLDCILPGGPDLQPLLLSWALEILGSDRAYPQKFSQREHLAPLQSGIPGPSHLGVHWLGNFPPILCQQQCASASCPLGTVLSLLRGAPPERHSPGLPLRCRNLPHLVIAPAVLHSAGAAKVFCLSRTSPLHHAIPSRSSLTNQVLSACLRTTPTPFSHLPWLSHLWFWASLYHWFPAPLSASSPSYVHKHEVHPFWTATLSSILSRKFWSGELPAPSPPPPSPARYTLTISPPFQSVAVPGNGALLWTCPPPPPPR